MSRGFTRMTRIREAGGSLTRRRGGRGEGGGRLAAAKSYPVVGRHSKDQLDDYVSEDDWHTTLALATRQCHPTPLTLFRVNEKCLDATAG